MRALAWQGTNEVAIRDVPDPSIEESTDAIVRVTSTAICGSDVHLYGVLSACADASTVFAEAGPADDLDQGCPAIATPDDGSAFVDGLAALRFWERPVAG